MTETTRTVSDWREIHVTGVDWATVVRAFSPGHGQSAYTGFGPGFSKVPSDWRARVHAAMEAKMLWADKDDAEPEWYATATERVILIARNPAFGAERGFAASRTGLLEDDVFGGWDILTGDDTSYVFAESGSSGSSITARRERGKPDTWSMTATFPILDGKVYEGLYYETFTAAVGQDIA